MNDGWESSPECTGLTREYHRSRDTLQRVVFREGRRIYTRGQVLSAAEFRGGLEPIRCAIRDGLASQKYANEEGFEIDAEATQADADAYRNARNLTTTEETEGWLEDHGLTLDDFTAYLERKYWIGRFSSQRSRIGHEYDPGAQEVDTLVWSQVVFDDHLDSLAEELAWRVAATREDNVEATKGSWLEDLARMEVHFREHRLRALSAERCRDELEASRLSLLRFEVGIASFPSEVQAREAFLCAALDGDSLEEVAQRAGGRYEQRTDFADGLPPAVLEVALSSAPGDTFPPSRGMETSQVYRFQRKIEPTLSDPLVLARVESAVVRSHFADLARKHITWESFAGRTQ